MKNEIDRMMTEIENVFLKNVSVETHHDGNYIDHENFLYEMREWLTEKFTYTDDIPRYSIREIVQDNLITGLSYNIEGEGNWVLYNDIRNLLQDREIIKSKLKEVESIINSTHRQTV